MRWSCFPALWGGVAIVATKFFLNQDCANRRIYLNLFVKFFVICLAEVLYKIQRPRPAEAALRVERGLNAKRFVRDDRYQLSTPDQLLKLLVITNARKVQTIDFRVLQKQRFVRRLKYGIPGNAMKAMHAMVPRRNHWPHGKSLAAQGQSREKKCGVLLNAHRLC